MNCFITKLSIVSFAALLCFPLNLSAEITYQCDGIWQSTPCTNGPATGTIELEGETEEEKEIIRQLSVKRSMLHELRMQAIQARRDYGVRFSTAEPEYVCLQALSDIAECRKLINESSSILSEMTLTKAKIKRHDPAEENDSEIETSQNQPVVVINQGRPDYYRGSASGADYGPPIYKPSPFGSPYSYRGGYTAGASAVILRPNEGRAHGHRGGGATIGGSYTGHGYSVGGGVFVPR